MNRTKVTVACQACQKKKVKCTGVAPCTNCNRTGHQCEFTGTAKKRGPRNGTVEVIKSSASRIENVLEKDPSLRPQIEQMMKRSSSVRSSTSRSPYGVSPIMIIDNDLRMDTTRSHSIHNAPRNFPYPTQRGPYSQRKHDRMNLYSYVRDENSMDLHSSHEIRQEIKQSPTLMRPVPKYPLNMRNHVTNGISNSQLPDHHQFSANTNSSHINPVAISQISQIPQSLPPIATFETSPIVECSSVQSNSQLKHRPLLPGTLSDVPRQTNTNPLPTLLQSLGEDPMKLPIPWLGQQPKKSMSMPIFGNYAGIKLLLSPPPDLGNPLDNNRLGQLKAQISTEYYSSASYEAQISNKTLSPTRTLPSPPSFSPPESTPKTYIYHDEKFPVNKSPLTPTSSPPSSPFSPYVLCQQWNNNENDVYKHNERINIERGGNNMDMNQTYSRQHNHLMLQS
ncbi:n-terminal binuclear zn cluster-containing/DNA binding domain-containing protein [Gigaspora margarita]|uniref:N-terminal binuclear zn cluster-containing/DNA binding domain-containing protein n=1 Tax=Gigaspora margarita TaxID=4874 RepID=A0A8H3WZX1_GIGMA|nr:n-terminal binuclear zn cluster-containing/DNA binding domain-containing protein [Gigaspora margarita]